MRVLGIVVLSSVLSACAASSAPSAPHAAPTASSPGTQPFVAGAIGGPGRLPPEVIQGVVRREFRQLRVCYERDLRRDPQAAGQVRVRFVIDREGRISDVTSASTETLAPGVATCIEDVFESLVFPPPEGGVVTVTYPIIFSVAPPPDAAGRPTLPP